MSSGNDPVRWMADRLAAMQKQLDEASRPKRTQTYASVDKLEEQNRQVADLQQRVQSIVAEPVTGTWTTSNEYYGRIKVTGLGRHIRVACDRQNTTGATVTGHTDTPIFQLPARYRPAYEHRTMLPWADTQTPRVTVSITTEGTVSVTTDTSVPIPPGSFICEYPLD